MTKCPWQKSFWTIIQGKWSKYTWKTPPKVGVKSWSTVADTQTPWVGMMHDRWEHSLGTVTLAIVLTLLTAPLTGVTMTWPSEPWERDGGTHGWLDRAGCPHLCCRMAGQYLPPWWVCGLLQIIIPCMPLSFFSQSWKRMDFNMVKQFAIDNFLPLAGYW